MLNKVNFHFFTEYSLYSLETVNFMGIIDFSSLTSY